MKKKESITRYTMDQLRKRQGKTDWKRLESISDEDIDTSDIPPLTDEQLANMVLVPAMTRDGKRDYAARVAEAMKDRQKTPISLRVEPSVLAWFKAQGKGYQSRMNAVLKAYMQAHQTF